ncbi:MAG: hypothetical protein GY739_19370 [Mesoflavibacter sp.]|nr:hypothetical protein [Mesoflavibacter sp.]
MAEMPLILKLIFLYLAWNFAVCVGLLGYSYLIKMRYDPDLEYIVRYKHIKLQDYEGSVLFDKSFSYELIISDKTHYINIPVNGKNYHSTLNGKKITLANTKSGFVVAYKNNASRELEIAEKSKLFSSKILPFAFRYFIRKKFHSQEF